MYFILRFLFKKLPEIFTSLYGLRKLKTLLAKSAFPLATVSLKPCPSTRNFVKTNNELLQGCRRLKDCVVIVDVSCSVTQFFLANIPECIGEWGGSKVSTKNPEM